MIVCILMTIFILFLISQALNKIKANLCALGHHLVNLHPFTYVPFVQYILKVKDVIESGDFFYCPQHGMFDTLPACWKKLTKAQRCKVSTLIAKLLGRWSIWSHFLNLDLLPLTMFLCFKLHFWQLMVMTPSFATSNHFLISMMVLLWNQVSWLKNTLTT